jgi:hypothetical protein
MSTVEPGSGMDWLDRYLQCHARVLFELTWFPFEMGQAGGLYEGARTEPEHRDKLAGMIAAMESTQEDFRTACYDMNALMDDVIANARRNLGDLAVP